MLRRSFRFCCDAATATKPVKKIETSVKPTLAEVPHLIEHDLMSTSKPFIDPGMLRSVTVSFLVGAFGVAAIYWLMSHKVTTEAMHRRRFIYSLAREEAEAQFSRKKSRYEQDPYEQFVSPSCKRYKDLVEQIEEDKRMLEQQAEQESGAGAGGRGQLLVDLSRRRRPSTVLSDAYHSSLLHETAVDSAKCLWNSCVENLQDALRKAMASWVDMREADTVAAVQELARSHLGERGVAVRVEKK